MVGSKSNQALTPPGFVSLSFRVPLEIHKMLELVANSERRSMAFVERELMELGLRIYRKNKLRMPLGDES